MCCHNQYFLLFQVYGHFNCFEIVKRSTLSVYFLKNEVLSQGKVNEKLLKLLSSWPEAVKCNVALFLLLEHADSIRKSVSSVTSSIRLSGFDFSQVYGFIYQDQLTGRSNSGKHHPPTSPPPSICHPCLMLARGVVITTYQLKSSKMRDYFVNFKPKKWRNMFLCVRT